MLGRYDILFAFPGSQLIALPDGGLLQDGVRQDGKQFLQQLDENYQQQKYTVSDLDDSRADCQELPFCGGWFLYLGYELALEVEPVLQASMPNPAYPRATMTEIPAGIVRDRLTGKDYVFASGENAQEQLEQILQDIHQLSALEESGGAHNPVSTQAASCDIREENSEQYLESVRRIKDYINQGDVFQVNLSRLWNADCEDELPASEAWRRLRKANPAPFAAWVRLNAEATLLSSSPERLLEVRQGSVRTRPIAGTYPRSEEISQDKRLSAELLMHPKERAEHIMLVDLERNDLGRICRPGSVHVDDLMVLESYAHVHHIVSGVSGELKADVLPGDTIRAVFPGGTITGCPKIRCMEIIAELEQQAREAYTGSVGYLCHNGDMDLNILIRTIIHDNNHYSFRAGAGIVADSKPARELEETRSKARGLKKIFEAAVGIPKS